MGECSADEAGGDGTENEVDYDDVSPLEEASPETTPVISGSGTKSNGRKTKDVKVIGEEL